MIDWIKENMVVSIVAGVLLILAGIGIVSSFRPSQQTKIEETAPVSSSGTAQNERLPRGNSRREELSYS